MVAPHPFIPLSKDAVASIFDVSTRTIENWVAQGIMPAPSSIGARVFWHPDLFYEWLDKRLRAASDLPSQDEIQEAKPLGRKADRTESRLHGARSRRLASIEANL